MLNSFRSLVAATALMAAPAVSAQMTIADVVVMASGGTTAGQFDTEGRDYDMLLTALRATGLDAAVADPAADLTVFAPNDFAFIRLARDLGFQGFTEQDAWDFLVAALTGLGNGDPIPVLTNVLLYHVAPGSVDVIDVFVASIRRQRIDTLLTGATIRPFFFILVDNDPDLRNPFITWPINLVASNGIIHGVTRVLVPLDI